MSRKAWPVRCSVRLYRTLLRMLPAWFGSRFAAEATAVFGELAADTYSRRGPGGLVMLWWRTLRDVVGGAWQERVTYRRVAALPDLRGAGRVLRREPWFALAVVATIALGVGSTTAIFTLVNGILLQPLPFPQSERVLALCEVDPQTAGYCVASPPNVRDLGAMTTSIDAVGAARSWRFRMQDGADSAPLVAGIATPGFFRVFSAEPIHGRLFTTDELAPGSNRVIVLTHGFWQRWSGGDPGVVGATLTLDGEPFTIIGVLGETHIPQFDHAEAWAPLTASPDNPEQRDWRGFVSVARMAEGIQIEAALAELRRSYAALTAEYPEDLEGWELQPERLRTRIAGDSAAVLRLFALAVGCLLLIGCANVANLLIVRAQTRGPEMAVRAALGAGRGRLAGQLLAESLLLSLVGGGLGLGLAAILVRAGIRFAPPGIPRIDEVGIDATVAAFALLLSVVTAILFGLIPAWRVARTDVGSVMRAARFGDAETARLRRGILVLELALAMALLTGAGLGMKGFLRLTSWDPGFDQDGLVITWMVADFSQLESGIEIAAQFEEVNRVVATLPGIEVVGQTSTGPLFGGIETGEVLIDGRQAGGELSTAQHFDIDATYFATLGVPVVRGRGVAATDTEDSEPVAVINEAMARRYWPDADPLGAEVSVGGHVATVVGVVRDMRPFSPAEPVRPGVYWPRRQYTRGATYLVMRTGLGPAAVDRLVRDRLAAEVPFVEVTSFSSLEERVGRELVSPRFQLLLVTAFAASALLLASVGIYSIVAYTVARQIHEIGVRMALGARPRQIVSRAVASGVRMALAGGFIGTLAAVSLSRSLESLLHGVPATDPVALAVVAGLFVAIAALASWLPARRAGRIDPVRALRAD